VRQFISKIKRIKVIKSFLALDIPFIFLAFKKSVHVLIPCLNRFSSAFLFILSKKMNEFCIIKLACISYLNMIWQNVQCRKIFKYTRSQIFMVLLSIEKKRCPICQNEIKGNDEIMYFCKNCFLLFKTYNLYKLFKKD